MSRREGEGVTLLIPRYGGGGGGGGGNGSMGACISPPHMV